MKNRIEQLLDNRWLLLGSRVLLGGVFLAASISKIQFQDDFITVCISYAVIPDNLARIYGMIVPWVELFIGTSLILGVFVRFSAVISILLTISFVIANTVALFNPVDSGCGCFGQLIILSHSTSIIMDFFMLIAGVVLLSGRSREGFLSISFFTGKYFAESTHRLKPLFRKGIEFVVVVVIMAIVAVIALNTKSPVQVESTNESEYYVSAYESGLDEELNTAIENDKLVLLYFYSEDCAACARAKPVIEKVAYNNGDSITLIRVEYDLNPDAVEQFDVAFTPTVFIITGKNSESQYVVFQKYEAIIEEEILQENVEKVL